MERQSFPLCSRGTTKQRIMKILQAGPITAGYENGFLRRIKYGATEVLRMMYFALRDHNWNTIANTIHNEQFKVDAGTFEIIYDCINVYEGADIIRWKSKIDGRADGSIVFEIQGEVQQDFRKNRAGFCMLHPLNIAGGECTILHPDDSKSILKFPVNVAPDDPFKKIQSMEWQSSGSTYVLVFEGDIFETEDQRNWCDASYKTFCTPLDKPFPVLMKRGEKIFQRVTFKPQGALRAAEAAPSRIILRDIGMTSILPLIGIGQSTEVPDLPAGVVPLLKALTLKHYRVDIYPGQQHWVTDFSRACENAFDLGLPLEAVLHLTTHYAEELEAFTVLCLQNRVKLRKILLLQTNALVTGEGVIGQVARLKANFPRVLIGAGTNYNFNEINKHHVSAATLDYISFSMDPQEHASDDLTILENMEAQGHLVRSAKSIYGDKMAVHISPVTLRKRYNPYATNPADLHIPETLKADPRQKEAFAAIWTFGSLCSLARGGASAVTYYQTIGNQGLMSADGISYPVYETIKSFAPYQGKSVSLLESSDPLAAQAIVLDQKLLGMINLTRAPRTVRFQDDEYELPSFGMRFLPLNRA